MKLNWSFLNRASSILWQTTLDIVFPVECLGCYQPGAFLCQTCRQQCIDTQIERHCPVCLTRSPVGSTHSKCLSPHAIDGIFAAGNYYDPLLQDAIKKLKYKNVKNISADLANFIYEQLKLNFVDLIADKNFVITFVPLHQKREHQRGYNQSELIALELSKLFKLPVTSTLVRVKHTKDQTKLDRLNRFLNLDKAFTLQTKVRSKNFLLIDDVFTTGATLLEASKVLKRNGAGLVWGITAAKESGANKKHSL